MTSDDITLLNVLAGVLIPLLVGIVTKLRAQSGVKAVVNAALTALAAAVNQLLIVDGDFIWREFAVDWATTWVVSVATYFGIWKPTGVAPAVQQSTADVGVG